MPESRPAGDTALLSMRGLRKRFGGTVALDGVDLDVRRGEIHALLGENGAGKSTLIKILAGVYELDEGEIRIDGKTFDPRSGGLPIAFIHQDLGLVEGATVAENIALVSGYGTRPGSPLISWRRTRDAARKALARVGSDLDPDVLVSTLGIAERSVVALARAIALETDLMLVLDEPTASLPEADVARLFTTLRALRDSGVAMIYVTHRLDEVFRVADTITVLRDGRRIATSDRADVTPDRLVMQIVGRPPSEVFAKPPRPSGAASLLEIRDLRVGDVGPVSARLQAGEILALVGLRGAGHDAVGRALFGDRPIDGGTIELRGERFSPTGVSHAISRGIGFVSSRRAEEGLAATLTVSENIYLNPTARGRGALQPISRATERRRASELIRRFDVRPPDPARAVGALSGGNQQKVVLARWIGLGSGVLVLEEPTVGVDVGAKADIYKLLNDTLDDSHGVLLVSSDFEEVAGIANRAIVFRRGRPYAELQRSELSVERVTEVATGASVEAVEKVV